MGYRVPPPIRPTRMLSFLWEVAGRERALARRLPGRMGQDLQLNL